MANHVQFKSSDQVIDAYDNNNILTWAIFVGKELFTTGDDGATLKATLGLLEEGATNCVYTLRVYRNANAQDIDNKTPNHGGFNFRLNGEDMTVTNGQYMTYIKTNELQSTINGLKREVEELKQGKDEPSKLGMIGELFDHPQIGDVLGKLALQLVDRLIPAQQSPQPGQQQFHRSAPVSMQGVGTIASDRELVDIIEWLQQHDPKFKEHMRKLKHIAEASPATFKIITDQLDSLTV